MFICNNNRNWIIYRKRPIRTRLTSMPRKVIPETRDLLKDKNILVGGAHVRSEIQMFAYAAICMRNVYPLN